MTEAGLEEHDSGPDSQRFWSNEKSVGYFLTTVQSVEGPPRRFQNLKDDQRLGVRGHSTPSYRSSRLHVSFGLACFGLTGGRDDVADLDKKMQLNRMKTLWNPSMFEKHGLNIQQQLMNSEHLFSVWRVSSAITFWCKSVSSLGVSSQTRHSLIRVCSVGERAERGGGQELCDGV